MAVGIKDSASGCAVHDSQPLTLSSQMLVQVLVPFHPIDDGLSSHSFTVSRQTLRALLCV